MRRVCAGHHVTAEVECVRVHHVTEEVEDAESVYRYPSCLVCGLITCITLKFGDLAKSRYQILRYG